MSKLSKLVWKRNGIMGRITMLRNNIQTMAAAKDILTKSEMSGLLHVETILDGLLRNKEENWNEIKKGIKDEQVTGNRES